MIATFLFYNEAQGKQLKYVYSKNFKHCNVILFDGDSFVSLESSRHGIIYRTVRAYSVSAILRNVKIIPSLVAVVAVHIKDKHTFPWRPLWIRSCNELCRHAASIDIGITLNPIHLYKKLLKYNGRRNYDVVYSWMR